MPTFARLFTPQQYERNPILRTHPANIRPRLRRVAPVDFRVPVHPYPLRRETRVIIHHLDPHVGGRNPHHRIMKRKRRVYVQTLLFDAEEMRIVEESCQRREYSDYARGAVDMMLAMLQQMPREQARLRNLNRVYMEAVCKAIIKDRDTLRQFQQGAEWRFYVERDAYGEIKGVTAKIDNKPETINKSK